MRRLFNWIIRCIKVSFKTVRVEFPSAIRAYSSYCSGLTEEYHHSWCPQSTHLERSPEPQGAQLLLGATLGAQGTPGGRSCSSSLPKRFWDHYQVCECEWGLFLDLSAFALHECKHGFENRYYLLVTDVLYNMQPTWTFTCCIPLLLPFPFCLKVPLKLLSLG